MGIASRIIFLLHLVFHDKCYLHLLLKLGTARQTCSARSNACPYLSFKAPRTSDSLNGAKAHLLDEDSATISEVWRRSLVGFFLGHKPHDLAIEAALTRAWKVEFKM